MAPTGIVDTLWFQVDDICREWGDRFDAWQDGLGQLILGLRADGKFAATVGGVVLSIPRQVAKTFIVMRIVFALCALFPDLTVLWTAHHLRTSTQTFQKLRGFASRSRVAPLIEYIRSANGEQEIRFRNGSRIMFGARSAGFGRGFDEVDFIVFDEAQILDEKSLEDMIPATNQSRFEHGALVLYMGTPPRPEDPGQVFTSRRGKALAAKPAGQVYAEHGNALYVECSADPKVGKPGGPSLDDLEQLRIANPSYPHRTPQEAIDRMREQLPSGDAWRREGLGVWDDFGDESGPFPPGAWLAGTDASSTLSPESRRCWGVDVSVDRTMAYVAVAGFRADGVPHVEVAAMRAGVEWVAPWFGDAERQERNGGEMVVALQAKGAPVSPLLEDLEAVDGVTVVPWAGDELGKATARFYDLVKASGLREQESGPPERGGVAHLPQPALDMAAATAVPKILTDGGMAWDRKKSPNDAAPLVAVTAALWLLLQPPPEPEPVSAYETRGVQTV